MSIHDDQDWQTVEIKAQLAEAGHIYCEPVPPPTTAQQLLWATTRAAELQGRIHRKDCAISTAIMWLSIGESQRAQEALNKGLLDL